jgi:hypothetical protein
MGPLFGAPLLLVEGDDDYRIWSQVPRHHVIKLAVLPSNGDEIKRYQTALENILRSLCEKRSNPMGYALLDADKPAPTPSSVSQNFIRYVNLNCHEAENLYLTQNVLSALGHTWETAKKALIAEAASYGQKRALIEACLNWDRRRADIKTIINEVAAILDKKNVPWSVRVGTAIGKERPAGELGDFLGSALVSALWP